MRLAIELLSYFRSVVEFLFCAMNHVRNTFVHERRHKCIKRYANHIHNAGSWFEQSVMLDQGLAHVQSLNGEMLDDLPSFLTIGQKRFVSAPKAAGPEILQSLAFYLGRYVEDSLVALAAVSKSGRLIKKDDVVLCTVAGHPQVGKIGFFSKVDDSYFALVKFWESSNDVNTFVVSEDHARWIQLADIEGAFAWRYASHDHVLISPPHV